MNKEIIDYIYREYDLDILKSLKSIIEQRIEAIEKYNNEEHPPIIGRCPKCGANIVDENDKYCYRCGNELKAK